MTLQVHDELVFEVPENEVEIMRALVRDQMENVHRLTGAAAGRGWGGTELAGLGIGAGLCSRPLRPQRVLDRAGDVLGQHFHLSSDSASIITRASASVPE